MNWILRKRGDGRAFGPLDDDALRRWAWDGLVDPDDEVSDDGGSTWGRAGAATVLDSFLREQARLPVLVGAVTIPTTAQRRRRKGSLLDLTPLIDCVFLLLIFFFVATTFDAGVPSAAAGSEAGSDVVSLDVSIPEVDDRPENVPQVLRQVRVMVTESGSITVDGQHVQLSSLADAIRLLRGQHNGITAIVLADSEVRYGQIARVVAAIEAGGIDRVLIGATGSGR